jgi:hypothetical protein
MTPVYFRAFSNCAEDTDFIPTDAELDNVLVVVSSDSGQADKPDTENFGYAEEGATDA